jgi:hypothetical protein
MSAVRTWGSTPDERQLVYACDRLMPHPDETCYRAVDVKAAPEVVFRWLCQLKTAPYSYDWIDNRGRTSPRHLVRGLDDLEVGQRAMTVFELADFDPGRQLTFSLNHPRRLRGLVVVTYSVVPRDRQSSRIVVKMLIRYPNPLSTVRRLLPLTGTIALLADLVMMRKQLFNLRDLAEHQRRPRSRRRGTDARPSRAHQGAGQR